MTYDAADDGRRSYELAIAEKRKEHMSQNGVDIDSIKIGNRHRKDLGNIKALAWSIDDVGLLHPVVVTPSMELIAGERRLSACKELGWVKIPVRVVDIDDIVRGEFAENSDRKDFLPSEIDAIRRAMLPAETEAAKERMEAGTPAKVSQGSGRATDKIGEFAGVSGRTVEKIAKVVDAAEKNPEKFGTLVEEMDRTGKVNGAYRKLRMADDEARVMSLQPVEGKHKTIVIDPPWDYDWLSLAGRAAPGYATMTHEELKALDVGQWADDDCHLYLWTTNNFMTRACELMEHWGFQHKTVLTWVKPRWGLGAYFRNQTEHVLFGVKGELRTRADDISTIIEGSMGAHSEKPQEFYDLVSKASYPPYGECFQRTGRADFRNLFEDSGGE